MHLIESLLNLEQLNLLCLGQAIAIKIELLEVNNMKLYKLFLIAITLYAGAATAAQDYFSMSYIQGEGDVRGIKVAYQNALDYQIEGFEELEIYLEANANFFEYDDPKRYDANLGLSLSPVIFYPIGSIAGNRVFAEFGIGLSLLDDTKFAGKNISTHYQFEDRLGIAMKFGEAEQHSVSLKYFHYSNAGIKKPNPGLDFISLSYSRSL